MEDGSESSDVLHISTINILPLIDVNLDEIKENNVKISWNRVEGAKSYFVLFVRENSSTLLGYKQLNTDTLSFVLTANNTSDAFPLIKGEKYTIYLDAYDREGFDGVDGPVTEPIQVNGSFTKLEFTY